ncbi:General stress protein 26 [Parelusimicrobium proximum]|uniref:pyridoxamine 5'-phosphate oxidase family protein n=1 Tax=Parelusimicrobium proximum TaxID=3228953 RepID=UPI003D17724A
MSEKVITKIRELLPAPQFIEFATVNEYGCPEVRAMLNLRSEKIAPHLKDFFKTEYMNIYFSTNTSSPKIKQLEKNKKASVYFTDPKTFEGVLLMGEAVEIKNKPVKDALWDDSWKMYYPEGKDSADYSIILFSPNEYKYYNGEFEVHRGKIS